MKACDSVTREDLYLPLFDFEFGISMKLVRAVRMCLNEPYGIIVGKFLSEAFRI
jgi:hypothetical protein